VRRIRYRARGPAVRQLPLGDSSRAPSWRAERIQRGAQPAEAQPRGRAGQLDRPGDVQRQRSEATARRAQPAGAAHRDDEPEAQQGGGHRRYHPGGRGDQCRADDDLAGTGPDGRRPEQPAVRAAARSEQPPEGGAEQLETEQLRRPGRDEHRGQEQRETDVNSGGHGYPGSELAGALDDHEEASTDTDSASEGEQDWRGTGYRLPVLHGAGEYGGEVLVGRLHRCLREQAPLGAGTGYQHIDV
jgi:hypothetical protein